MIDEQRISEMHAELDGELSQERAEELRAWLSQDPARQARYEEERLLLRSLDSVPHSEPPASLAGDIIDFVEKHSEPRPDQLEGRSPVFTVGARSRRVSYPATRNSFRPTGGTGSMSKKTMSRSNKTIFAAGAALAVFAAVMAHYNFSYAPDEGDMSGAIVAAKRYRAEQMDQNDVRLGDTSVQEFMQTEAFDRLVNDPQFRALVSDPAFVKFAQDPALLKFAQDPAFLKFAQDPALLKFASDPALVKFAQDPALLKFAQDPALMKFAQDPALLNFAQDPALMKYAQDPSLLKFAQDPALLKFAQDPAFLKFAQDPSLLKFAQDPAFLKFAQDPALLKFAQDPSLLKFAQDPAFLKFAQDASFAGRSN